MQQQLQALLNEQIQSQMTEGFNRLRQQFQRAEQQPEGEEYDDEQGEQMEEDEQGLQALLGDLSNIDTDVFGNQPAQAFQSEQ